MAEPSLDVKVRAQRRAKNKHEEHDRLDAEIRLYQQNRWNAETAKIARLRALRVARDAAVLNGRPFSKLKRLETKNPDDTTAGGSD